MRQLASIRTIDKIEPIDGADRIEKATVGGWNVVVGKGLHKARDQVIFCEIDSAIPVADKRLDPDGNLAARGTKAIDGAEYHVLKTVKLRGVVSQGLILPLSVLSRVQRLRNYFGLLDPDVTDTLGIIKWGPFEKEKKGRTLKYYRDPNLIGPFPTDVARKSDSERVQNLGKYWGELQQMPWVVTEKIDGQSVTLWNRDGGTTGVASRNYEVKNHPARDWALKNGFESEVPPFYAIQGEWAGPGIQGNRLGLKENRLFVFDVFYMGEPVPVDEWPQWARARRVPEIHTVTNLLGIPDMIGSWDGVKSMIAHDRLAEGVVYRTADDTALPQLGHRPNFKVISNKYLLKEKN